MFHKRQKLSICTASEIFFSSLKTFPNGKCEVVTESASHHLPDVSNFALDALLAIGKPLEQVSTVLVSPTTANIGDLFTEIQPTKTEDKE